MPEKTAEELMIEKFQSESEKAITKALNAFKEGDEQYKAIKSIQEQIAKLKPEESEVVKTLVKNLDELGVQVKGLLEKPAGKPSTKTADVLKANMEKLRLIAKGGNDVIDLQIKAVSNRASIDSNEQAFDLPDIGQLATRKITMYDLFPKLNIGTSNNNGVIRYYDWDEDTTVRAAAMIAEGGNFPESTAKFKKYSLELQKVGDTLPVTAEFFEDEAMFAAELEMFLKINMALKKDAQIANGDGTGNNLKGLFASVSSYTLPVAGTVQNATIYDLIVKVSEAITTTGGAKYMPNFAVMNIADINKMKLAKDELGNYIMPPFVSRDGSQVGTIVVFEANIVAANSMVIGDSRFARIYEKNGLMVERGYGDGQFIADEMTLKVRERLAFLIRTADKSGFLKVLDIDAAVAAINLA